MGLHSDTRSGGMTKSGRTGLQQDMRYALDIVYTKGLRVNYDGAIIGYVANYSQISGNNHIYKMIINASTNLVEVYLDDKCVYIYKDYPVAASDYPFKIVAAVKQYSLKECTSIKTRTTPVTSNNLPLMGVSPGHNHYHFDNTNFISRGYNFYVNTGITTTNGVHGNNSLGNIMSELSSNDIGLSISSLGDVGIGTFTPGVVVNTNGGGSWSGPNPPNYGSKYKLNIKGGDISSKACQIMIENESYNKGIEFRYVSASGNTQDFPQAKLYTSGNNYETKLHFSTAKGSSSNQIDKSNTTSVEVMTLDDNGYVGIGTTTPVCPLDVIGKAYQSISTRAYFNSLADSATGPGVSGDLITIKAEKYIWAGGALLVTSDERIKENIQDIPDEFSLQKIRDISCVWYNYKDKIAKGSGKVAGFLAQQVKEHLPEAVNIEKSIIPNEMKILQDISWNSFDISGSDSSGNPIDISGIGLKMSCDLTDVSGVKYRFYVSNDLSANDEVMKEIVGNIDNTFTFDTSYNNVFCYGIEVDDFHILDKQKLFLNFSATQELDKIVIALKEENNILKERWKLRKKII